MRPTHDAAREPMKRFATALLYAIVGYAAGAIAGYVLVQQFSPNVHDRSVEAAMTAAFVAGPLAAAIAFVVGLVRGGGSPTPPA